jgi:hypothetical protein
MVKKEVSLGRPDADGCCDLETHGLRRGSPPVQEEKASFERGLFFVRNKVIERVSRDPKRKERR